MTWCLNRRLDPPSSHWGRSNWAISLHQPLCLSSSGPEGEEAGGGEGERQRCRHQRKGNILRFSLQLFSSPLHSRFNFPVFFQENDENGEPEVDDEEEEEVDEEDEEDDGEGMKYNFSLLTKFLTAAFSHGINLHPAGEEEDEEDDEDDIEGGTKRAAEEDDDDEEVRQRNHILILRATTQGTVLHLLSFSGRRDQEAENRRRRLMCFLPSC